MSKQQAPFGLEERAVGGSNEGAEIYSIAISIKRIADALEKIAVVSIEAYDWVRNMPAVKP